VVSRTITTAEPESGISASVIRPAPLGLMPESGPKASSARPLPRKRSRMNAATGAAAATVKAENSRLAPTSTNRMTKNSCEPWPKCTGSTA
jgi:hypothetical protein